MILKSFALVPGALLCGLAFAQSLSAEVRAQALEAATMAEVRALLGVAAVPEPGRRIRLEVPDIVALPKRGHADAKVRVTSELPATEWIAVLVDPAPRPLVAVETIAPGSAAVVETAVPVSRTLRVRALVRAGGRFYEVSREAKAAAPGCPRP